MRTLIPFNQVQHLNFEEYLPAVENYNRKVDHLEKRYDGLYYHAIVEDLECLQIKNVFVIDWKPYIHSSKWLYVCENCFCRTCKN